MQHGRCPYNLRPFSRQTNISNYSENSIDIRMSRLWWQLWNKNREVTTRQAFPIGIASMNYELTMWGDRRTSRWLKTTSPYRHIELFHQSLAWNLSLDESDGFVCATLKHQTNNFANCCSTAHRLQGLQSAELREGCWRFQTPNPLLLDMCKTWRTT